MVNGKNLTESVRSIEGQVRSNILFLGISKYLDTYIHIRQYNIKVLIS